MECRALPAADTCMPGGPPPRWRLVTQVAKARWLQDFVALGPVPDPQPSGQTSRDASRPGEGRGGYPQAFRRARMPVALVLVAALGACTNINVPLVGTLGGSPGEPQAAARPQPDARGVISYPTYQVAVAEPGDTVATIAGRLGLESETLARENGLPSDAALRGGEVLLLPRRVADLETPDGSPLGTPGEVSVETLAGAALDRADAETANTQTAAVAPAETAPAPAPRTQEPQRHRVARGETAFTIARQYQVSVGALADWNGLDEALTVREGQTLLIPIAAAAPPPRVAETEAPGQGSVTPVPPSASAPQPDDDVPAASAQAPAAPVADLASEQTSASDTTRLMQPVSGRIVRRYEPGQNEGLDFAGGPGAPVRAAAGGTVAAITRDVDEVPIIVVRHDDDLLTVYANVGEVSVEKGARVERGQNIGTLRDGEDSVLHFEVREGFDSVDPLPYLSQ